MVRIGTVQNISGTQVRVLFPDVGIVSGWLTVVNSSLAMPSVGDTVLCIYGEGFNADGYVIGGLQ